VTKKIERREFLKKLGVGAGTLSAAPLMNASTLGNSVPAEIAPRQQETDWQEIDRAHEEKVQMFLANVGTDELFWNNKMAYTMDGDVKVFEITCSNIMWATEEGNERPAFAYNGTVPGPEMSRDGNRRTERI